MLKKKNIILIFIATLCSFMFAESNNNTNELFNPNCTNCYEPIAEAGQDLTYYKEGTVTLNALDSFDPDGSDLTYEWIVPAGIFLNSNTSATPQFQAPDVSVDTEYIIELIVNDGDYNSESDYVTITIVAQNTAPVIESIDQISVNKNDSFVIDASTSYDATLTGTLSFTWDIPDELTVSGTDNASSILLVAPDVSQDQDFNITLTVSDGYDTASKLITATVIANIKPYAIPGQDQQVAAGTEFTLDAGDSFDPDNSGFLSYLWSWDDSECEFEIVGGSVNDAELTLRAPLDQGECNIYLTVNDGIEDSNPENGSQLFISEYIESGSDGINCSQDKLIEIFNPTSSSIDLTDFEIWYISGSGEWAEKKLLFNKTDSAVDHGLSSSSVKNSADQDCSQVDESGDCTISSIEAGETLVIVKSDSFLNCVDVNVDNWVEFSSLSHNGDDPIGLYYAGEGVIDAIGEPPIDPGTGWNVAGVENGTKDKQLIRKELISNGNSDWPSSSGTSTEDSEWIVYDADADISKTGNHYCSICDNFVTITITDNQAPIANAGDDFTAFVGSTIVLDASGSSDIDTDFSSLIFTWSSDDVELFNSNTPSPSFVVPDNDGESLSFNLTVSDGAGSSSDSVEVTITSINENPEASIAISGMYYDSDFDGVLNEFPYNGEAYESYIVQLDASASFDETQTGILNFSWTSPEGFDLNDATISNPTFYVNEYIGQNQTLTFEVLVTDGDANLTGAIASVDVNLIAKLPVINVAQESFTSVIENDTLLFDASTSINPSGNIIDANVEFNWLSLGAVEIKGACFTNIGYGDAEICNDDSDCLEEDASCRIDGPLVYAITPGSIGEDTEYIVRVDLEYTEGVGVNAVTYDSEFLEVSIDVEAKWPVANNNNSSIEAVAGTEVILDGSFSSDPQEESVTYGSWNETGTTWSGSSTNNFIAFYENYELVAKEGYSFAWEEILDPLEDSKGSFVDASAVSPIFQISQNAIEGDEIELGLIVFDGEFYSTSFLTTITIVENESPQADSGVNSRSYPGNEVLLDGSGSFDLTETGALTYNWESVDGIDIENSTQAIASFVAPNVNFGESLDLNFVLTVADGFGLESDPDTVNVVISQFSRPVSPSLYATAESEQINLFWDNISEDAIDSLTLYSDFQGYRIYRSEDYGNTWGPVDSMIIDSETGETLGWKPYAIFDLSEDQDTSYCLYKNDFQGCEKTRGKEISGADPYKSWYSLGSNSGLAQAFVDTNVVDGIDYTYTITAFDRGVREDTLQYGSYGNGAEDLGGTSELWRPGLPDHVFYEHMLADSFAYHKLDYIIKDSYIDELANLTYVLDPPDGVVDGNSIWTVKNIWPSTNPDGYLVGGIGQGSLESLRGSITFDDEGYISDYSDNLVVVSSGFLPSDITFPTDENLDDFIAADCKAVGTGDRFYEVVNQSDLTTGLIKLEIQAEQGINAFLGYAMEDACLYAYSVMKIEEENKLPYYSPTTFVDDVEELILPVEAVEDSYNGVPLDDLDGLPGVVIDYSQDPATIVMPDYLLECHPLAYLDDPNFENNWTQFFDGVRMRFDNALRSLPTDKNAAIYDAYSYPDSALVNEVLLAESFSGPGGWGGGSLNTSELELQFYNSFDKKPSFDYEIEFSTTSLDTAIATSPSSGCVSGNNTLLPFKIKNLTTGKYVKVSHLDKGIWNGIDTDVPSWFTGDPTDHPGYGDCIWEPGELIQFEKDTVIVGDALEPSANQTFQMKLFYEQDLLRFTTYICGGFFGSYDQFDPTSEYNSGECIYNEGLVWYSTTDISPNYNFEPGAWDDSDSDGINDNPWMPIYLWHDALANNKIVIQPQKWYVDGDYWIADMSMLGAPIEITQESLDEIQVVPNPYMVNSRFNETPDDRRLRFTHLPQTCKITIFTISGEIVDVINHDNRFDGNAWWDLRNAKGKLVAPGLYIYRVETDDGLDFVSKFAIVR